jgi:Arc/MetJ-type ribon-helix-helix transcriptional regulator
MKSASAPLTIDLPASLTEKIEAIRAAHGFNSASEAIRMALAEFDMSCFRSDEEPRIQISVRIDSETRKRLKRISKSNDVSVGAIVRAALEAVPAKRKK